MRLEAGRNRILFRLNQQEAQWMAALRIRTPDGNLPDVVGVPLGEQALGRGGSAGGAQPAAGEGG